MKSKRTLVLAVACIVASLLLWWCLRDVTSSVVPEPVSPIVPSAARSASSMPAAEVPPLAHGEERPTAAPSPASARKLTVEPEPEATARTEDWQHLSLELTAVDERGCPVSDASVYLAPLDHPMNHAGWTDGSGRFRIRWPCKRSRMRVALSVESEQEGESGLRSFEVSGEPLSIVVPLYPAARADATASALFASSDARRKQLEALGYGDGAESTAARARVGPADRRETSVVFDHGLAVFVERSSAPSERAAVPRDWTFPGKKELERKRDGASITGVVRAADGTTVQGVCIRAWSERQDYGDVAETDGDGGFRFDHVPDGAIHMQALGGSLGRAETTLTLSKGATMQWDASLAHDAPFAGRVTGAHGEPLSAWHVEVSSVRGGSPWLASARSIADGTFTIDGAPEGALSIDVCAPMHASRLPSAIVRNVVAGLASPFAFESLALPRASVEMRFAAERGFTAPDVEASLWDLDSGRGVWLERRPRDGKLFAQHLPAGRYRVVAGRKQRAWIRSKLVTLAPDEAADLGVLTFLEPGRMSVEPPADSDGALEAVLFLRGSATDSLVAAFDLDRPLERELAPGEYWIATRRGGDWRRVEFAVESQTTTRVDVSASASQTGLAWNELEVSAQRPPRR